MAFAGLHVACGYYGASVYQSEFDTIPVIGKALWSENPSTGVATTNVAPAVTKGTTPGRIGQPVMRVRVSGDTYVAIGASPDPSAGARHFQAANTTVDYAVEPGDKLKWIAVP